MPELTWLQDPDVLYRYALVQSLNGIPWWLPDRVALHLADRRATAIQKAVFPDA